MNIAPGELVDWLETEESKSVGDDDGGESTGHKSGRRTVEIERTTRCAVSITRSASTSFPRADVSASVQGAEERTSPIYENRSGKVLPCGKMWCDAAPTAGAHPAGCGPEPAHSPSHVISREAILCHSCRIVRARSARSSREPPSLAPGDP